MRLRRQIKIELGLNLIHLAPMLSVFFLMLIFLMLSSILTTPSGINVKLPKTLTSDTIQDKNIIIRITSEDIIYLANTIMTTKDLKRTLQKSGVNNQPVLIMADRRSSMGRIVDVWDICRDVGIERINIATTKEGL